MSLLFFPCPAFQHPGRTVPSFLRLVSLFHGSCCSHLSLLLEQVLSSSEMTSVLFLCHAIIFGGIPRVMGCQVFGIPWPLLTLDSSLTIRFPVGSVCNLPEGCSGCLCRCHFTARCNFLPASPQALLLGQASSCSCTSLLPVITCPSDSGFIASGFNQVNLWCLWFENRRVEHIWGSPFCPANRACLLSVQWVIVSGPMFPPVTWWE